MINTAYKHLDSRLRIAELTIGQWTGIFAGVVIALVYGYFVHPFGTMPTVVSAMYIGGLPIAGAMLAAFTEFDVWLLMRSAVGWRRLDGRYLPGPGAPSPGYRLDEPDEKRWDQNGHRLATLDVASLWGDR
jgi:hypothetical protein